MELELLVKSIHVEVFEVDYVGRFLMWNCSVIALKADCSRAVSSWKGFDVVALELHWGIDWHFQVDGIVRFFMESALKLLCHCSATALHLL